jgi:hypothetical protein
MSEDWVFYFDATDGLTFLAMILVVSASFFTARAIWPTNIKRQAWAINLLCSFTLSVFGTSSFINVHIKNLWTNEFIYADDRMSRAIMIFFLAVNTMDLVLGAIFYREHLHPLTTICHHIYFICVLFGMLGVHRTTGMILTFIMEIPTFVLTVGTIWPEYRSDLWFAITFFIFRLGVHMYMIYRLVILSPEGIIWRFCAGVLPLHMYWGYRLIVTYYQKYFGSKKNQTKGDKQN